MQKQGTTPYCRTNSCALRVIQFIPPAGFFYWQLASKRLICSILFECSVHVIYRILLEPLRMNRPRTNAPEAIEPRATPLPDERGKSFSGLANMRTTIAIPLLPLQGILQFYMIIASPPAIIALYTLLAFSYTRAKAPCLSPMRSPHPFPHPSLPSQCFSLWSSCASRNLLLDAFDPFM